MQSKDNQVTDFFDICTHLDQIYTDVEGSIEREQMTRYQDLTKRFEKIYGAKPKYFFRAPGRVNLIGEHVDYSGYAVFPCALEQDTVIAYGEHSENEIVINHTQSSIYPALTLSNDPNQKLNEEHDFSNYFIASYKGALSGHNVTAPKGMKLLISGDLPTSAGLSSSSSFMVACMLLTIYVNGLHQKVTKKNVIDNAIKYERMLGIACGGMDQTIVVLGEKGSAFYVEFDPMRYEKATLPKGVEIIVANSLTPSPKMLTLGTRYNKRVVECRIALKIFMKKLLIKDSHNFKTFKELQTFLEYKFDDMIELVKEHLEERPYKIDELEKFFECPLMKVVGDIPHADRVINENHEFFPYHRAYHVFTESERVLKFREICKNEPADAAEQLGKLMDESQYSCRDNYDCSSEELEKLTAQCRKLGAYGSRLTGAGWGGCCVSLVKQENVASFIEAVQQEYYMNTQNKLMVADDLNMYIFASFPGKGAAILDPQYEVWY